MFGSAWAARFPREGRSISSRTARPLPFADRHRKCEIHISLYKPIELPHALQLVHAMAVVEFHIMFDAAIAGQTDVTLEAWFNEGDVINADDPDPAKHYRLHTKLSDKPRVSCSPDAAFLLNRGGQRAAYYLELERGNGNGGTGSRQLAERKCPGYAEVAKQKIYLNHFPAAGIDGFHVLLVAPHGQRRDAIRRAFQQKDAAVFRTDLWRFAAHTDISGRYPAD